jgi:hypothetical protein
MTCAVSSSMLPAVRRQTVAALFVDAHGVYASVDGVDAWDIERDARRYAGPWPVVAHPPCNKWSPLAYINRRRLPDYRIGDDGGCFASALRAVRVWGGVLEHPAHSLAWRAFQLTRPRRGAWSLPDEYGGCVTELDQGVYGHRARKRTWLYAVGASVPLDWRVADSDVVVSGFLHRTGPNESRRVRPREAASTPPAFRDALVDIARGTYTKG